MSDKRTVVMVTVVLDTTDFRPIEEMSRAMRAVYEKAHTLHPGLVDGGYVVAMEMPADDASEVEANLMRMAKEAAAAGAPIESSNPASAAMFTRISKAREQ